MATSDYVIDNQTAPNFRADLNNALLAIVSNNSSATAPAVTYANMMWYDTATNILYMRNEDNDAWIALGTLDQTADTFSASVALASQAEAEAGTNNAKVMTPLRTVNAIRRFAGYKYGLAQYNIGQGQVVQNTRAEAAFLQLGCYGNNDSGRSDFDVQISSDGVNWARVGRFNTSQNDDDNNVSFPILNNHYFRVIRTQGGNTAMFVTVSEFF